MLWRTWAICHEVLPVHTYLQAREGFIALRVAGGKSAIPPQEEEEAPAKKPKWHEAMKEEELGKSAGQFEKALLFQEHAKKAAEHAKKAASMMERYMAEDEGIDAPAGINPKELAKRLGVEERDELGDTDNEEGEVVDDDDDGDNMPQVPVNKKKRKSA
ncbi:hypothetical protein UCREL1_11557 [Eutypa lata UCREL1]|uniref:Uncharacterized protein n=1 Tax=Eutypa lata (strain UCR-EL1) TaxID=1287681 RepID=M7T4E6_EUTLA|nr:hypothetical protein UCREL1_11557 [Eutypa lata UCREL1]